jgi:hypothetical protein
MPYPMHRSISVKTVEEQREISTLSAITSVISLEEGEMDLAIAGRELELSENLVESASRRASGLTQGFEGLPQ